MGEKNIYFLYATKQELLDIGVPEEDIYVDADAKPKEPISASLTKEQCLKLIPEGEYCYLRNEHGDFIRCPFWDMMPNIPRQSNGFCHFLKEGDFTSDGLSLLWDEVKSCGENDSEEEFYE